MSNLVSSRLRQNINKALLIALTILSLPLIAMQFTAEFVWTLGDFSVAGILLMAAIMSCFALREFRHHAFIVWLIVPILLSFLGLWISLAVII